MASQNQHCASHTKYTDTQGIAQPKLPKPTQLKLTDNWGLPAAAYPQRDKRAIEVTFMILFVNDLSQ